MGDQNTLPRKPKKFLFDLNDFDRPAREEEPEDLPPPPPTFSEQELESAKHDSFKSGRSAGLAEAESKREKFVAGLLDTISQNLLALFLAEDTRESRFEAESVALSRAIFSRLFPGLNEKHGIDEIERVILNVLETNRERAEIIIEVHPDYAEDITRHIEAASARNHMKGSCVVRGSENLGPGDCRMHWNDGGAIRDATGLAARIEAELQQVLADRPLLRDNKKTET